MRRRVEVPRGGTIMPKRIHHADPIGFYARPGLGTGQVSFLRITQTERLG